MSYRIPRYLGPAVSLPNGFYTREPQRLISGDVVAIVRCIECGAVLELGAEHTFDRAGTVTPVFGCSTESCSWFEWLVLDGWGEDVIT
jgi:hypothetical protein